MAQQVAFVAPAHARQTVQQPLEISGKTRAIWDGQDFSEDFRNNVLNGILPFIWLGISVLSFLLILARYFYRHRQHTTYKPVSQFVDSDIDDGHVAGSVAIARAENEVLLKVAIEQSPDFSPRDVRKLGGESGAVAADSLDTRDVPSITPLRTVWRSKKDVIELALSGGVAGLLAWRTVQMQDAKQGVNWSFGALALWSWLTVLAITKLVMLITHHSRELRRNASCTPISPRRLPNLYTTIEIHTIPWYLAYSVVSFLALRSCLLANDRHSLSIWAPVFALTSTLCLIEAFSPRLSRYPSSGAQDLPPSPEIHSSLFGLATFSFLDAFMFKSAFPRVYGVPPLSMASVPDLRPDDKTARVLLGYRRDMANTTPAFIKRRGLTWRLVWHFRQELLQQQMWAYLRSTVVCAPPLLLRALLRHISERDQPVHVAVMYAFALMLLQIASALAESQALYIGRRLCIRLRSVVVGEIFTKALRRKDAAGKSSDAEEDKVDTAPSAPKDEAKEEEALTEELKRASSGKILNLISVDTFRVSEICAYLHFVWPELPLTIVITVVLLFNLLGWSAVAGVAILLLITPMQAAASRLFLKYQEKLLAAADKRLNLATEVISSVRIVKYFAWERKFLETMDETRQKELDALWSRALTMIAGGVLMFGAPVIVSVATFVFHTKVLHRDLTAEAAFTSLALFNILRGPLEMFTDMLVNVLQALVSLRRIDAFMAEEDTSKYSIVRPRTSSSDPVVGFTNGTFTWSDEQLARDDATVFRLRNLNLSFPVGKFSIVLGPVGSGKSTLLLSLLGETNCLEGACFLPSPVGRPLSAQPSVLTDTTAYASQSPWLESLTIRDNIVFGSAFDEMRYLDVLEACALEPDLKQFELGDDTEVGEKGTVLSGGQKARISLARAVYSSAKFVLLDDVLSAVDSHTAQHLVAKCLKGRLMRHRTCILVTHAVDLCLPVASYVVSMNNGIVASCGAPEEVELDKGFDDVVKDLDRKAQHNGGVDSNMSAFSIEAIAAGETDQAVLAVKAREKRERQEKLKLIKDETQSEGAVSKEVYFMYIRAMGGWTYFTASLSVFIAAQLAEVGVSVALRYWAGSYDDKQESLSSLTATSLHHSVNRWRAVPHLVATTLQPDSDTVHSSDYWLKLYVALAVVNLAFYGGRVGFFLYRGLVASRVIYSDLISRILGAPIRFFDSTPTGRILNRLSKDMETIDQDVAMSAMFLLLEFISVIAIIGTISSVLPQFLIAAAFLTLLYCCMGYLYITSSRELKRSDSVTRSPMFSLFGEVLSGVSTIRAYGDSSRFMKNALRLLDTNNRPFITLWQANRWLSVRVDVFGALVTFAASLAVLAATKMDAALAGFAISFAISFNERILWLVRMYSTCEVNANSVERVQEYLSLEQESQGGVSPPAIWPSRTGTIEVQGLTASYAPDLPPVLKGVSFKVEPGEKIGICGRTGSGKSTLGLSFFRFIEPTSGRIVIDGIDINTLKLADLRSRMTIVAQETALFAGTLRFNLDPFEEYTDADIWDALRRVQMAAPSSSARPTPRPSRPGSPVDSEEGTITDANDRFVVKSLSMVVSESGKNFSKGQAQLLALARGILKLRAGNSSILIADESTASLDRETDERIQETIRTELRESTILCIAHRLGTIIDMHKVLVLGAGEVLEFDTPYNLLQRDSVFADLCRKSGEYESLRRVAEERHHNPL